VSFELIPKKPKKGPVELQLTALIDVFSMIVIFLVLGGVMGAPDIVIPESMKIPKSKSKEGIESAPRVTLESDKVSFSLSSKPIPLQAFSNPDSRERLVQELKPFASEYFKKQTEAKNSVKAINVIADQSTPYRDIFDVVLVFRKMGFGSVLFVANGEAGAKR
jgi:biopolymer transport protein ExbD